MSFSVMMLNKINIYLGNFWFMWGYLYIKKFFIVINFLDRGLLKIFWILLLGYFLWKLFNLSKFKEFLIKKNYVIVEIIFVLINGLREDLMI